MAFACLLRLLPKDQIYNRIIVYEPLPPFSSIESPIYLHQALISQQQPPAGQPCPTEPCLKRFIFWNKYSRWFHPASPLILSSLPPLSVSECIGEWEEGNWSLQQSSSLQQSAAHPGPALGSARLSLHNLYLLNSGSFANRTLGETYYVSPKYLSLDNSL